MLTTAHVQVAAQLLWLNQRPLTKMVVEVVPEMAAHMVTQALKFKMFKTLLELAIVNVLMSHREFIQISFIFKQISEMDYYAPKYRFCLQ